MDRQKPTYFSTLLSVYKKERPEYLNQALESIWEDQTLKPSQVVLVQDGPLTPDLYSVISLWEEKLGSTLTSVILNENVGLAAALNEGLKFCEYELIARMDTDDVATPERFKLQLQFMNENPEISVSSGRINEYTDDLKTQLSTRELPLTHDSIYNFAKRRNPISHTCAIFKKSAVLSVGGYPNIYPEDYALWVLMLAKGYRFANIPQTLVKVRVGDAFNTRRGWEFLKGEIKAFKLMYKIGFINKALYISNVLQRGFLRLSPNWMKKILYQIMR